MFALFFFVLRLPLRLALIMQSILLIFINALSVSPSYPQHSTRALNFQYSPLKFSLLNENNQECALSEYKMEDKSQTLFQMPLLTDILRQSNVGPARNHI